MKSKPKSVLQEAEQIINGPRRQSYGPAGKSFEKIAGGWSSIVGTPISPRQVALMMIWLKVCRDANKPGRDNLVDAAGYAGLADLL
jgi:hypothetical protein